MNRGGDEQPFHAISLIFQPIVAYKPRFAHCRHYSLRISDYHLEVFVVDITLVVDELVQRLWFHVMLYPELGL
jgi:hypothetical protein